MWGLPDVTVASFLKKRRNGRWSREVEWLASLLDKRLPKSQGYDKMDENAPLYRGWSRATISSQGQFRTVTNSDNDKQRLTQSRRVKLLISYDNKTNNDSSVGTERSNLNNILNVSTRYYDDYMVDTECNAIRSDKCSNVTVIDFKRNVSDCRGIVKSQRKEDNFELHVPVRKNNVQCNSPGKHSLTSVEKMNHEKQYENDEASRLHFHHSLHHSNAHCEWNNIDIVEEDVVDEILDNHRQLKQEMRCPRPAPDVQPVTEKASRRFDLSLRRCSSRKSPGHRKRRAVVGGLEANDPSWPSALLSFDRGVSPSGPKSPHNFVTSSPLEKWI